MTELLRRSASPRGWSGSRAGSPFHDISPVLRKVVGASILAAIASASLGSLPTSLDRLATATDQQRSDTRLLSHVAPAAPVSPTFDQLTSSTPEETAAMERAARPEDARAIPIRVEPNSKQVAVLPPVRRVVSESRRARVPPPPARSTAVSNDIVPPPGPNPDRGGS